MIAAVGVVAPTIGGWVASHLLLGLTISLSVAVLLLLWAGTRVERELRGDFGIRLKDVFDRPWNKLAVTNDSGKWAKFRADVTAIDPPPAAPQASTWAIAWSETRDREEAIEPRGTQYLCLCRGDVILRSGGNTGSTTFKTVTGEIVYQYRNAQAARSPIVVSVRVSRLGSHAKIEKTFKIWHEFNDSDLRAGNFIIEPADGA
jgi:hypothetical protein